MSPDQKNNLLRILVRKLISGFFSFILMLSLKLKVLLWLKLVVDMVEVGC